MADRALGGVRTISFSRSVNLKFSEQTRHDVTADSIEDLGGVAITSVTLMPAPVGDDYNPWIVSVTRRLVVPDSYVNRMATPTPMP